MIRILDILIPRFVTAYIFYKFEEATRSYTIVEETFNPKSESFEQATHLTVVKGVKIFDIIFPYQELEMEIIKDEEES